MDSQSEPTTGELWAILARAIVENPKLLLDPEMWTMLWIAVIVTVLGWPFRAAQRGD